MSEERLIALETALAHVQREVEQLNSVLLEQQREVDAVRRAIELLKSQSVEQTESAEKSNPLEERPPHY